MPGDYFRCRYCGFRVSRFRTRKGGESGTSGPDAQWLKLRDHVLESHGVMAMDDYHELGAEEFIALESLEAERDGWDW